jgi:RNA polymerase sigma factor (sigma-70 family)
VGLLQGLLGSRIVAEELAQEAFLAAYRHWDRVGGLDNPRAWVRKVALNQRGSFLRAYHRQQARERESAVRLEDDTIKLADEHAQVWEAIRTLPPSQAQVIALHYYEDYSVAQIAAALGRAPGHDQGAAPPWPAEAGPAARRRDRPGEADMNLDDRLRAAGQALREGSATQVDAAGGLREIVHAGRLPAAGPATPPPGQPARPVPASTLLRRTQRLALAVNLLLVVVLGVALAVVAGGARHGVGSGVSTQRTARTSPSTSIPPASTVLPRTVVQVPQACLESTELADEIISSLTRNERDNRLAVALRDYSIASQACREQAPTPTLPTTGG